MLHGGLQGFVQVCLGLSRRTQAATQAGQLGRVQCSRIVGGLSRPDALGDCEKRTQHGAGVLVAIDADHQADRPSSSIVLERLCQRHGRGAVVRAVQDNGRTRCLDDFESPRPAQLRQTPRDSRFVNAGKRTCRLDSQRRGIGGKLVETALRFCQDNGYLKVTLDTFMEREPAVSLFQKYRFRHSRSRTVGGKELMYFYLDLYTSDVKKDE